MEISMKAQWQGHRKGHNYNFPSEGDFFLYSNLRSATTVITYYR